MPAAAVLSIGTLEERSVRPSFPRVRVACAIVLTAGLEVGAFALACDVAWRTYVGPSHFWILSQSLFLVALTLIAAAAACDMIVEREDAPRGFSMAAFGVLTIGSAALCDTLWRAAFGAETTLWTPFYLMGLFGAAFAVAGCALVLAGLARMPAFRWLLYLQLANGFTLTVAAALPGAREFPLVGAGPVGILTLPIICAFGLTFVMLAAQTFERSRRAVVAAAALYVVAQRVVFAPAATLAVRESVATQHATYRVAGFEPHYSAAALAPVLLLLAVAWLVAHAGTRKWSADATGAAAGAALAAVTALWVALAQGAGAGTPVDDVVRHALAPGAFLASLPPTIALAALAGAAAARLGARFGALLRAETPA
jgi:hypothetical protein